jgi:hypothetical protein
MKMYHFRDRAGNEVDIVLKNTQGEVVAIEAKNTETLSPKTLKTEGKNEEIFFM